MGSIKTLKAKVYGRVQGVFFRKATFEVALRLGVTGYVQNCYDGTVEIVATGDSDKLHTLLVWANEGPPFARVEEVHLEEIPLEEFSNFTIRR